MSPKYRPWLLAIGFGLIGLSLVGTPAMRMFHVIDGEVYESPLPDEIYEAAQASDTAVESYLAAFGVELPGQPLIWMGLLMLLFGLAGYRIGLRVERYRAARQARRHE